MSQSTLQFVFRVNDTPTSVTSVVLSSQDGTYGAKRDDTNEVIVAAGTPMVKGDDNVYRYVITDPPPGVIVSWVACAVYEGVTYRFEFDQATDAALPTARPSTGQTDPWFQAAAPVARPVTAAELRRHCYLDADETASGVTDAELNDFIDAAVEYAETALGASLMPRTMVATFHDGQALDLPRGPIISVQTIADRQGNGAPYELQTIGRITRVMPSRGLMYPVTVTYRAGYVSPTDLTTAAVPADIRMAIRQHAATLYANRESISEKAMAPVPHMLEQFYMRKTRVPGVF